MNRLLILFRRAAAWTQRLVHRVTGGVHHLATATVARLTARWHADSVYRRTLIAAASALSATVLPHPAAAAAVGALLADHASAPSFSRGGYVDEYDEYDDYRHHHREPRTPWSTGPTRLWEAFD